MINFATYTDSQLKNSWGQLKSSLRCLRTNGWLMNQEMIWRKNLEDFEREMERRNINFKIKTNGKV